MNQPLGQYSGLKCEVFESMEILKGNSSKDIMEIITPVIKINLRGTKEKDTKPSRAKALAPKKEKLVFPAYLESLSYSTPACLNPTQDLNPLINKFF